MEGAKRGMKKIPVGLAVGVVWKEFNNSCIDTLRKISEIGYKGIEPTGVSPIPVNDFAKAIKEFDLKVTSTHILLDELEKNINRYIEFNKSVNCTNIVCPWLPEQLRRNESDYLNVATRFNEVGARCKEEGIQFSYHHHNFEFIRYNGRYALDLLLKETDPELVCLELDTYWVKYSGEYPEDFVRRYKNRIHLLHLKDMADGIEKSFTEIGNGVMDFNTIVNETDEGIIKWLLVEQDETKLPPFESIKISFENLKRIGLV